MKISLVALDDMLVEWILNGLQELPDHEVEMVFLNRLPNVEDALFQTVCGADLVVYAGPAGGPHAPSTKTLRRIRQWDSRTVFLCFDASDIGWHPLLAEYRKAECFDLIVNCDGCKDWPQDSRSLTSWCPVGRTGFLNRPHVVRPIEFGFCGGHRSEPRRSIVDHLVRTAGLVVKPRDDKYGTYHAYTDFLGDCRIVLNIAYSAGGPHGQDPMTKQFKARIVECGFAGTLVLETRGSAAADWLTPGVDFLTYESAEEAEWIVRHATPEYVQRVAANLHRRVTTELSPQKFWSRVFGALQ